jgi:hypothetical protein
MKAATMERFFCADSARITPELVEGYRPVGAVESRHLLTRELTPRRWRYLQRAECVVAKAGPRLLGLAAYHRVQSDARVVHEFLVDPDLGAREAAIVTDTLASAVEAMALSDSVHCLMFMLWPDVRREPFERRGYRVVVLDAYLAWLQKTLDQGSCIHVCSPYLH